MIGRQARRDRKNPSDCSRNRGPYTPTGSRSGATSTTLGMPPKPAAERRPRERSPGRSARRVARVWSCTRTVHSPATRPSCGGAAGGGRAGVWARTGLRQQRRSGGRAAATSSRCRRRAHGRSGRERALVARRGADAPAARCTRDRLDTVPGVSHRRAFSRSSAVSAPSVTARSAGAARRDPRGPWSSPPAGVWSTRFPAVCCTRRGPPAGSRVRAPRPD